MEGGKSFRTRNQTAMSHHLAYPLAVERAMENPNYATLGSGYNPKSQHSQASKLGRKHMMPMEGAGWWDDFKQGFRSVGDVALHPLLSVLPYGNLASAGLRAVGLGKAKAGGRTKAGSDYGMGRTKAGATPYHMRMPHIERMLQMEGMGRTKAGAKKLGRTQMMHMGATDGMEGAGWWDDFKQGFKSVGDVALHPLLSVLPYGNIASAGLKAVGLGKAKAGGKARAGGRTKAGAKQSCGGSDGRMTRASMVAKVMREQGLPLGKASKYVKDHKLY